MDEGKEQLVYLYCITGQKPILSKLSQLMEKPSVFEQNQLYAIVSQVAEEEFNKSNLKKNLQNLSWVEEKVRIHELVIEEVMKNACLIPFRFATLFHTKENLTSYLRANAQQFEEKLAYLEGKEEWGVKMYCSRDKARETIQTEDKELIRIEQEISASTPGKAYILRKKKENFLAEALKSKIDLWKRESLQQLGEKSLHSCLNALLPKEATKRIEEMVLNSGFLIEQKKRDHFFDTLAILAERLSGQGIIFECTGPWPPYNFCTSLTEENQ